MGEAAGERYKFSDVFSSVAFRCSALVESPPGGGALSFAPVSNLSFCVLIGGVSMLVMTAGGSGRPFDARLPIDPGIVAVLRSDRDPCRRP